MLSLFLVLVHIKFDVYLVISLISPGLGQNSSRFSLKVRCTLHSSGYCTTSSAHFNWYDYFLQLHIISHASSFSLAVILQLTSCFTRQVKKMLVAHLQVLKSQNIEQSRLMKMPIVQIISRYGHVCKTKASYYDLSYLNCLKAEKITL